MSLEVPPVPPRPLPPSLPPTHAPSSQPRLGNIHHDARKLAQGTRNYSGRRAGGDAANSLPGAPLACTLSPPGARRAARCPRGVGLPSGGGAAPCWPPRRPGCGAGEAARVFRVWLVGAGLPSHWASDCQGFCFLGPHLSFSGTAEQQQRPFPEPQVSGAFPGTVSALTSPLPRAPQGAVIGVVRPQESRKRRALPLWRGGRGAGRSLGASPSAPSLRAR